MMQISTRQMNALQEARLAPWVHAMVATLTRRYGPVDTPLDGQALAARCRAMAREAVLLGIDDSFDLLRLGEMVFALRPDMQLCRLPPGLVKVLQDLRFSGEDRVDIVTLRLAFPPPGVPT